MQFNKSRSPSGFTLLALTLFFPLLMAQQSSNLTITFSKADLNTCAISNSSNGLTFSTSSLPDRSECFNLDEIFTQNSTIGFRNETPSTTVPQPERGIWWLVHKPESFDPLANYSHILYQQVNPGGNIGAGRKASRSLTIYNGRDCQQVGDPLQPWFGWSCQTKISGDCETVPYNLQSFSINQADRSGDELNCWSFAYEGSAARISPSKWTLVNTIARAILAIVATTMITT